MLRVMCVKVFILFYPFKNEINILSLIEYGNKAKR